MKTVKRLGTVAVVKWVGLPAILAAAAVLGLILVLTLVGALLGAGSAVARDYADAQAAAANAGGTCRVAGAQGEGGQRVAVPEEFREPVADAAKASGLPEEIVAAQISAESGFSTTANSPVGAQGPAQFMPETWAQWGEGGDPTDPADAMAAYGRYMQHLLSLAKDWETDGGPDAARLAVAAYNAGEGAPGLSQGQLPPYAETQNYVAKIFDGAQEDFSVNCEQAVGVSDVELGDGEWSRVLPGGQFVSGYGVRDLIAGCAPGDYSYASGCFANLHMGVDIATPGAGTAPGGTVLAPTDGEIVCLPGKDGMLQMRVDNGKDSDMLISFWHTDKQFVQVGDKVKRGDPVAQEGNQGFSMGTHLHVEIMKPGTPACAPPSQEYNVDPLPILKEKGAL